MNWLTALNASRRSAACGEAKNCIANKQQHQIFRILVYHCQKQQQHKSQRNFISYWTTCLLPVRDRSFFPSRLSNNTNNTGNGTPVVRVFKKQYIPEAALEERHWLGALIDLTHLGPILLAYPHISAKTVKRLPLSFFVELNNNPPTNWKSLLIIIPPWLVLHCFSVLQKWCS